jgi:hypothetical protein
MYFGEVPIQTSTPHRFCRGAVICVVWLKWAFIHYVCIIST